MADDGERVRSRLVTVVVAAAAALALVVLGLVGRRAFSPVPRDERTPANGEPGRGIEPAAPPVLQARGSAGAPESPTDASVAAVSDVALVARDVRGEPVAGVALDVLDDRSDWDAPTVLASGTTDDAGKVLLRLGPGPCRVRARHARFHADVVRFVAPTAVPVLVPLFVGVPLRVLVTKGDGKPITGARVREIEVGQGATFTTGADGIADLGAVHGTWSGVTVDAVGFLERFEWATSAWKRDATRPLEVRLVRAGPLVVRVRREGDGRPEPGASVWVRHGGGDARGTTDASGIVRFDAAAAPPSVELLVTSVNGRHAAMQVVAVADLAPRETVVVVPAGRTVAGIAVRSTDGRPVAGATVRRELSSGEWVEVARTDPEGRFRLEGMSGAAGSAVGIRVRAVGWSGPDEDATSPPPVQAGPVPGPDGEDEPTDDRPPAERDTALRVVLEPTVALVGRVVGPDGQPASGASVEVSSPQTTPLTFAPLETRTDAQGRYRIEDVPRWEHLAVIAEAGRLGVRTTDDSLPEPAAGVVAIPDLALPGTWDLDVPVVDEDGRPVPIAWLEVRQRVRTQGQLQWRRTVSDGRFHRLEGLSREGVGVELTAPGFLPDALRVDPDTTQIVVNRPCRVRGRLVDADGRPLASTEIHLISKDRLWTLAGNEARTKTDAEGRFDAQGLRRGRYEVDGRGGELVVASDDHQAGDVVVRGDPR